MTFIQYNGDGGAGGGGGGIFSIQPCPPEENCLIWQTLHFCHPPVTLEFVQYLICFTLCNSFTDSNHPQFYFGLTSKRYHAMLN